MVVLCEYFFKNQRGYYFSQDKPTFNHNPLYVKDGITAFTADIKLKSESDKFLKEIYCKCEKSSRYDIKSFNKLPSHNWHEFIDYWSCHKNEFEALTKRKIAPRPKGILFESFYFLVNEDDIPTCCINNHINYYTGRIRKIYYNFVNLRVGSEALFYYFLSDYFEVNCELTINGIELKDFGDCAVLLKDSSNFIRARKIGFKKSRVENRELVVDLNEFYEDELLKILNRNELTRKENGNKLNVTLLDYKLSYMILKENTE